LATVDPATGSRPGLDSVLGRVEDLLDELLDSLRYTFFVQERLSVLAGLDSERSGGPP
jgi:hypothetical protein